MNQDFRSMTKNELWTYVVNHFDDEIASDTFIERFTMEISTKAIETLLQAGLLISAYPPIHAAYPNGLSVAKPNSVDGNSLPDYDTVWDMTGIRLDAPCLKLHSDGHNWYVTSHDWIPGPGLGDFVNIWDSEDAAVADIIDFYLGDPKRMQTKIRS